MPWDPLTGRPIEVDLLLTWGGALPRTTGRRPPHVRGVATVILAALVAVVSTLVMPVAGRAAAGPEFFGTNLQTYDALDSAGKARVPAELAAGRMNVNRYEVRWNLVEPAAPKNGVHTYQWSGTDAMVARMAAAGVRVAPLFRFTPGWVGGGSNLRLPPAFYDDYAELIAAFARRYGPGGSFWASRPDLPARPTLSYEVWNEVNLDEYAWNQQVDPAAYAEVLRRVRPAVRAVQPGARIVLGGLAWQRSGPGVHPEFVSELAAAGGLALVDVVGYHPYAPDAQSTLDLVVSLRRELEAVGYPDLPIWANEAGQEAVVTNPDGTLLPDRAPARFGHDLYPSDAARGANLALAGEVLAASDCGVEQFLPYAVAGTEDDSLPLTEGFMGLFRRYGGAPTLSAQALQRASQRWAGRFNAGGPGAPSTPLAICHPERGTPDAALLHLTTSFAFPAVGCATASISYDGNPLESAYLRLLAPSGAQVAEGRSDAFGSAAACIPENLRGQPFYAYVGVAGAARSAVIACDEPGIGCPPGTRLGDLMSATPVSVRALLHPATPPQSPGGSGPPAAPSGPCRWSLALDPRGFAPQRSSKPVRGVAARVRRRGSRIGTQTLRLTAACDTEPSKARLRVELTVRRKGAKKHRRVVVLRLVNGKRRTVKIAGLRSGDRLAAVARSSKKAKATARTTIRITATGAAGQRKR